MDLQATRATSCVKEKKSDAGCYNRLQVSMPLGSSQCDQTCILGFHEAARKSIYMQLARTDATLKIFKRMRL